MSSKTDTFIVKIDASLLSEEDPLDFFPLKP